MRVFVLSVLVLCLTAIAMPTSAAGLLSASSGSDSGDSSGDGSVEVNKENIDNLIGTLENEEERQKFIDNLKALKSADEQQTTQEEAMTISGKFGLRDQMEGLIESYEDAVTSYDMDSSLVAKGGASLGIILVAWFLVWLLHKATGALGRWIGNLGNEYSIPYKRIQLYVRILNEIGHALIAVLAIFALATLWNVTNFAFLDGEFLADLIGHALSLFLVIAIGVLIWEVISAAIEVTMERQMTSETASNRLRTLLPIVRNVVFFTFCVLFTLVILSELGINIMPLLAGAGIVGIAIGFGAQTMVKDFLTGFTIILEDLIQVGDVATLGGKIGLIERITIRKVQLRDLSGIVYTVPFSDISIVENWTKDFSFYSMDIGVAYRENTDEVIGYLKEIDEDLRSDDDFKDLILEPIEIMGVDAFADSAVIIKARIKTQPIKQWAVGREFNRRMKMKFDEKGIEIPFPHQTLYFGEDKKGKAPPAHVMVKELAEDADVHQNENGKAKKNKKSSKTEDTSNPHDMAAPGNQDQDAE